MAVTKLSLYNDALQLLGERRLASDTEDREPRYDLDNLYDNGGIDYVLEVVKPRYATEFEQITGGAPTADVTWDWQIALPADFIAIFDEIDGKPAVYQDGRAESPITRFQREADYLLMDFETPWIRYVKAHDDTQLPNIPPSFGRVISAYFARELAWKYDPDSEDVLTERLAERIQVSREIEISNSPPMRGFAPDVLTDTLRGIYNDAFQILDLEPIVSNTDDSLRKNRISIALDNGLVKSVFEDTTWNFALESDQLFANPSINPPWGYEYAFDLPADLLRMDGIYQDELMRTPIRDYVDQVDIGTGNRQIFCSYQIIFISYISSQWETEYDQWPTYFRRLVAARMALDANIEGGNKEKAIAQYTTRRKEAMSTNAINGPPKTLALGRWSRSRLYRGNMNRDRP